MKTVTLSIVTGFGLCALAGSWLPAAHAQWSSGHYDYVPHTQTHYHYVPHDGHYHVVPHTTTHYDGVWHDTSGWNSGYGGYYGNGAVPYRPYQPYQPYGGMTQQPTVITNQIPTTPSPNVVPSTTSAAGSTVQIVNPAKNAGTVNYSINASAYSTKPGDTQTLNGTQPLTISFDNGRGRQLRYRLDGGTYEFRVDETNGWSLVFLR